MPELYKTYTVEKKSEHGHKLNKYISYQTPINGCPVILFKEECIKYENYSTPVGVETRRTLNVPDNVKSNLVEITKTYNVYLFEIIVTDTSKLSEFINSKYKI